MPVKDLGDPRLEAMFRPPEPVDQGARPTISLPRRGLPPIAIAGIVAFVALLLFLTLEMRRTARLEPPPETADAVGQIGTAPPPLYLPPQTALPQPAFVDQRPVAAAPSPRPVIVEQSRPVPIVYLPPQPAPQVTLPQPLPQPRVTGGAPLVVDVDSTRAGAGATPGITGAATDGLSFGPIGRVRASAFANRSMTVPQGHLIPAVLESGFDSTQPGFARAIVSRDVRGFDNKNVLIPRGSRLIGQYRSVVAQGQRRAIISWTRLIRPDGMTIAMDSPAVDPLGRGGVPANVDTHFFQRFGDALLQSTVSLGSLLGAGRAVTGPVVMVSGTAASAAQQLSSGNNYVPTLTVPAGKSISVFVAHDLDFSTAARSR